VHTGDKVIVLTYADYEDAELDGFEPRVVHVDARNQVLEELQPHAGLQPVSQ
jgi:aspartate 1-decarboxylase